MKLQNQRIHRMQKQAINQMLHYHERSGNQKRKDLVKKLAGRKVPPEDIIFWPTGLLANVLAGNYESWEDKEAVSDALAAYFDRWIDRNMPIYYLDDILCGEALLDLYRLTGNARYKAGADKMAEYIYRLQEEDADRAGSIPYRHGHGNGHIYVDGIGMICPFLCKYGMSFGDGKAIDIALTQIRNILDYGMEDKMFLPYHGFEYESKLKYGIIGWGRAAGWLLLGIAGSLKALAAGPAKTVERVNDENYWKDEKYKQYEELKEQFIRLIESVSAYQKENGAFSWQIPALEGPEDSSATAMIAWAAVMGMESGMIQESESIETCGQLVKKAAEYIAQCEDNGTIGQSSGECRGFSEYPQTYGAYPWSLAPGLAVLVAPGHLPKAGTPVID